MSTLADVVVGLFFSLWFMFSVVAQFEWSLSRRIREFDHFGFVPGWTFFAPVPGTSDYHLIYREATPDSVPSEWVEVPIVQSRRWFHFAWNPDRRKSKVIADAVTALALQVSDAKPTGNGVPHAVRLLPLTVPYLILLSTVMARDRDRPLRGSGAAISTTDSSGHVVSEATLVGSEQVQVTYV